MRKLLWSLWRETDGVLSFEWTVLTSVLTIGAVAGIATVRDAVQDEMADLAEAMTSLDQSYAIPPPLAIAVHSNASYGIGGGAVGPWRVQEFDKRTGRMRSFGRGTYGGAGSGYRDRHPQIERTQPEAPKPGPEAQGYLPALDSSEDS